MNTPIFLNCRLPSDISSLLSILERWESYGAEYCEADKDKYAQIIVPISSSFESFETENFPHLKILKIKHSTLYGLAILSHITRLIRVDANRRFILITGVSPLDMVFGIFLRVSYGRRVKLQIQFHGNVYFFRKNLSPLGFLRVLASRLAIACADSIRVVSNFQIDEIASLMGYRGSLCVVAPIPIDLKKISSKRSGRKANLVSIVGRLHPDRGVDLFLRIVAEACKRNPQLNFVIVGTGPKRDNVERMQRKFPRQVSFVGHQDSKFLKEIYGSSKVLLSAAPHEGYGLVLREAILSGVLVIAHESEGVAELASDFPNQVLRYSTMEEAVNLLLIANQINVEPPNIKFVQKQIKSDCAGIQRWVRSWDN